MCRCMYTDIEETELRGDKEDMDCSGSSFSFSSLLCEEREDSLLKVEESLNNIVINSLNSFYFTDVEDEYLDILLKKEMGFGSKSTSSFHGTDHSDDGGAGNRRGWLMRARLDAIQWILNTRESLGFQFHTAYLSVTYFDRFLSRRFIKDGEVWAIRLLSLACLSLAAKMEECIVPILSDYSLDDYYFENKVIQRMELLILSTLEWKMGSVTPFAYLNYLIEKLGGQSRIQVILERAAEFIMAAIRDIDLMNHRPSVIACASVLAAIDGQLTKKTLELRLGAISTLGSIQTEHVLSCYNSMQEIDRGSIRTPASVLSSHFSSTPLSSRDIVENTSFNSATTCGIKRKLDFGDNGESCPMQKVHRT